jgi:hypothetical protein
VVGLGVGCGARVGVGVVVGTGIITGMLVGREGELRGVEVGAGGDGLGAAVELCWEGGVV